MRNMIFMGRKGNMIFMGRKVIVCAALAPHKNRDIFLGIKKKE